MNINAKIATTILRAQNASDGGKHIDLLVADQRGYRDNCAGYSQKDVMVSTAIRLICSTKNENAFKFSVQKDAESVANYLVYFETRINGEKLQVSFHSFNHELKKYVNKSFRMKWDHGDSRESAVRIYSHYVPNGRYLGGEEGGDAYD